MFVQLSSKTLKRLLVTAALADLAVLVSVNLAVSSVPGYLFLARAAGLAFVVAIFWLPLFVAPRNEPGSDPTMA